MKSFIKPFIILMLCIITAASIFCLGGSGLTAYAYTDAEKEAAKAWLSSHGYSPTMSGAQQAYQDYLDGKIDPYGGSGSAEAVVPSDDTVISEADKDALNNIKNKVAETESSEKNVAKDKSNIEKSAELSVLDINREKRLSGEVDYGDYDKNNNKQDVVIITQINQISSNILNNIRAGGRLSINKSYAGAADSRQFRIVIILISAIICVMAADFIMYFYGARKNKVAVKSGS